MKWYNEYKADMVNSGTLEDIKKLEELGLIKIIAVTNYKEFEVDYDPELSTYCCESFDIVLENLRKFNNLSIDVMLKADGVIYVTSRIIEQ